jgi:ketosteroid isomerase-like protein
VNWYQVAEANWSIELRRSDNLKLSLVLFLLVVSPIALSGTHDGTPNQVGQILKLESDWNDAHLRGDVETLDRLWAPELTVIVPEMSLFTKPDLLNMWKKVKVTFTRYQTSDVQVRCTGQTAVVTGRLERSRNFGGQVRDEDWLYTKTYARLNGEWKVVSYHASIRPVKRQ